MLILDYIEESEETLLNDLKEWQDDFEQYDEHLNDLKQCRVEILSAQKDMSVDLGHLLKYIENEEIIVKRDMKSSSENIVLITNKLMMFQYSKTINKFNSPINGEQNNNN